MSTLALDPGDTTGWALFGADGQYLNRGQVDLEGLFDLLENAAMTERVLVEDFRLWAHRAKQQSGSRFVAAQAIGAVKLWAYREGVEVVMMTTEAKVLGAMYSGVKPPSNHKRSHEVDAYNIGIYDLVTRGIITAPAMR